MDGCSVRDPNTHAILSSLSLLKSRFSLPITSHTITPSPAKNQTLRFRCVAIGSHFCSLLGRFTVYIYSLAPAVYLSLPLPPHRSYMPHTHCEKMFSKRFNYICEAAWHKIMDRVHVHRDKFTALYLIKECCGVVLCSPFMPSKQKCEQVWVRVRVSVIWTHHHHARSHPLTKHTCIECRTPDNNNRIEYIIALAHTRTQADTSMCFVWWMRHFVHHIQSSLIHLWRGTCK